MKNKFCLYTDLLEKVGGYSDEDLGDLFRGILTYVNGGEVSFSSPTASVCFSFVKADLDAFQEAYDQRVKKLAENGKKGGRPKKANVFAENQTKANGFSENQTKAKKAVRIGKDRKEYISNIYMVESFGKFWSAYPLKVAKQSAFKIWQKLAPDETLTETIITSLEKQKRSEQWKKDGGQFIPHPATWLNGRRWEDELAPARGHGYAEGDCDFDALLKAGSEQL